MASICSDFRDEPLASWEGIPCLYRHAGSAFCCVGLVADVINKDLLVNLVAAMLAYGLYWYLAKAVTC